MLILEELKEAFNLDLEETLLEYYSELTPEQFEAAPIPDYIFDLINKIGINKFKEAFFDWTINGIGPSIKLKTYFGLYDSDGIPASNHDAVKVYNNFIDKHGIKAFLETVAKAAKWDDELDWAIFMKHKGFMSDEDFNIVWDRCHPQPTPEEKSRKRIDNGIGRMFADTNENPSNYYKEVLESIDRYLSKDSFIEAVNNINKALNTWLGHKVKFDTEKLLQDMPPKEAFHKIAEIIETNNLNNGVFILLQAVPDRDIKKVKKYLKELIA